LKAGDDMPDKKPVSKAQQAATAKYKKSNYDRMEILLSKGRKAELQSHAAAHDESLNSFVNRAIDETVEHDNAKGVDFDVANV
jgi:predicted HicB family RNase H-like nuclease